MLGHVGPKRSTGLDSRDGARAVGRCASANPLRWRNAREITGPALGGESGHTGTLVIDGPQASDAPISTRYHSMAARRTVAPLPSFVTAPGDRRERPPADRVRFMRGRHHRCRCAGRWGRAGRAARDGPRRAGRLRAAAHARRQSLRPTRRRSRSCAPTTLRTASAPAGADLAARTPIYAIWDGPRLRPERLRRHGTEEGGFAAHLPRVLGQSRMRRAGECRLLLHRPARRRSVSSCSTAATWRSPDKAKDGPDKTMWGAKQLEWLKRELLASKAAIKLLANGSEWQTFQLARFLRRVSSRGATRSSHGSMSRRSRGVMLLSGGPALRRGLPRARAIRRVFEWPVRQRQRNAATEIRSASPVTTKAGCGSCSISTPRAAEPAVKRGSCGRPAADCSSAACLLGRKSTAAKKIALSPLSAQGPAAWKPKPAIINPA